MRRCVKCGTKKMNNDLLCEKCAKELDEKFSKRKEKRSVMLKSSFNDMLKCYETNDDFREYVDKCVKTYGNDINHVLKQPITEQYYQYLNKIGDYDETKSKGI